MFGNWNMPRRRVLRGFGVSVALPLLDVMVSPVRAATTASQTARLAYLYIPNGVAEGAWGPEKVDSNGRLIRLNRWMSSLQPHVDQLTIFRNMWTPRGNGHGAGTATWLTGGGFDDLKINVGGASADQIAARHFRSETLLPSLEMSSRGEGMFSGSLPRNSLSWADDSTPLPRDIEPRVIFDRMFRVGKSGLASRSVLDLIMEDTRSLKRRVSDHDQKKIDEYLESVRSIERGIQFAERQQKRARRNRLLQDTLVPPEPGISDDHEAWMRSMLDMIVLAFWADATRVCTFMMDHGQSNRYFDFIDDVKGTWHALSHWKDASGRTEDDDGKTSWDSPEQKRDMYNRVTKWHTDQVAYLLQRLRSVKEAGATLLDNSMIVYGSSIADGHEHAEEDLPLLVAGGGAGAIRPGRLVGGRRKTSMSRLHLSLLSGLGVDQTRFADASDPLNLS